MPQLDIDILEDFLFFAFAGLLLGFGDDETEENAIERHSEAHLAHYYLSTRKALRAEADLIAKAPRVGLGSAKQFDLWFCSWSRTYPVLQQRLWARSSAGRAFVF